MLYCFPFACFLSHSPGSIAMWPTANSCDGVGDTWGKTFEYSGQPVSCLGSRRPTPMELVFIGEPSYGTS